MTLEFISRLRRGFRQFLEWPSYGLTTPSRANDFQDDERDLSARQYEYDYWAMRGPWY
jgi:hypothetical protein